MSAKRSPVFTFSLPPVSYATGYTTIAKCPQATTKTD